MYDEVMREEFKKNKNSVIGFLVMASFVYYHRPHADPILSDIVFDKACKWLYDNFDKVEHKLKPLITKEDLAAGSLYSLRCEDYPLIVIHLAEMLSNGNDSFLKYYSS